MAVFTETIKLDDQVSAPAKAAGDAVLSFTERMKAGKLAAAAARAAAAGLGKTTETLPGATKKASEGFENLTAAMLRTQAKAGTGKADQAALAKATRLAEKEKASAVKEATQKQIAEQAKMANVLSVTRDAVGSAVQGMKSALASLASGDVKGAIAGVTDTFAGLAKMLDLVVPGLGQAVVAVIQIAGGIVGITAGLIKSGVEMAISATQSKNAMIGMFDALGEGKITGEQVDDMLDGLSDKLGVTKDAMIPLVQKFAAMGITSQDALEKMTTAALSAKALAGGADSGAQAFENLSKKIQLASETGQGLKIPIKGLGSLAEMGLSVDDVAKKMGVSAKVLAEQLKAGSANAGKFGDALQSALIDKGAGALEEMGNSADNLKAILQQSIGDMFEDMKPEVAALVKEVKALFSIFGKGSESGKAMKAGIGGALHEIFGTITRVIPIAKHFLLDMVIYGLKAYLAIKPIVKTIKEFVASARGAAIISAVLSSLWEVLKAIGVSILVIVAVAAVLWAAMIAVSVAVWTAIGAVLSFVNEAGTALSGWVASAATAAYDFVAGLVNGIANGASQVIGAVTGLAGKATGAFKSALGIASPSKVMMGMGGNMAAGVSEGLEGGEKDVSAASTGVASASVKGMSEGASGSGKASPGGGGGAPITVYVSIDGAGKSAAEITEEMVSACFQRIALGAGL